MREIDKYETINKSDTIEQLQEAIMAIADKDGTIQGRRRPWDAKEQAAYVTKVVREDAAANLLTRSYGIRQQALYLKYYNK